MKFCVLLCVLGALVVSTNAQDESTSALTLTKELHHFKCYQPAETGPCKAAFTKWFYNYKTNQCETFTYGGCKGNSNRFDTKAECEAACVRRPVDICALKPDSGPCRAAIPRWFFNKAKGECQKFIYGGCKGNKNNFKTREECQNACRKDCFPVNCFANPCEVTKCEAFPHADCVPNFCNGCDADFFVDGRPVDCEKKPNPPPCQPEGKQCRNLKFVVTDGAIGTVYLPPCCKGTVCCACGPPVVTDYTAVPLFGTCQKRCFCPKG